MDALMSNQPPLADQLDIRHENLKAQIAAALEGVEPHPIANDEEAIAARDTIKPLLDLQKAAETAFRAEKQPFLDGGRTVEAFFKTLRADLDRIVQGMRAAGDAYVTKKREDARKAEAARVRIAQQMEETAPAPAAPRDTTRVSDAAGAAVSGRVTWAHEVVDASLLPRDLLMPNDAAIKARRDGLKAQGISVDDAKIPGVRIFEKAGATWR